MIDVDLLDVHSYYYILISDWCFFVLFFNKFWQSRAAV